MKILGILIVWRFLAHLCSGECNIRVDLLLIIPALYILSVVALVKYFRRGGGRGKA